MKNVEYFVTDPYDDIWYTKFDKSINNCAEEYVNEISPLNTWITGITDNDGESRNVGWESQSDLHIGTYEVKITVNDALCYTAPPVSATYTLEVKSQCWVVDIVIDPTDTIFKFPSIT